VVTVTRIDRLARSTFDLFAIVKGISDAQAHFRSMAGDCACSAYAMVHRRDHRTHRSRLHSFHRVDAKSRYQHPDDAVSHCIILSRCARFAGDYRGLCSLRDKIRGHDRGAARLFRPSRRGHSRNFAHRRRSLDDRFHEAGMDEAASMELEAYWWIPRLRRTERGAV